MSRNPYLFGACIIHTLVPLLFGVNPMRPAVDAGKIARARRKNAKICPECGKDMKDPDCAYSDHGGC